MSSSLIIRYSFSPIFISVGPYFAKIIFSPVLTERGMIFSSSVFPPLSAPIIFSFSRFFFVAGFDRKRNVFSILGFAPHSRRNDFSLLRLFFGGFGNDDSSERFPL